MRKIVYCQYNKAWNSEEETNRVIVEEKNTKFKIMNIGTYKNKCIS